MGGQSQEDTGAKPLPRWLSDETELDTYLARKYGLTVGPELSELMEQLDGLVMRDQIEIDGDSIEDRQHRRRDKLSLQRTRVRSDTLEIIETARKARKNLASLKRSIASFNEGIGGDFWSSVMLTDVFDIEFIPLNCVEPPEVFDSLRLAFQQAYWAKVMDDLAKIADLPVRKKLRNNTVRNHVLEQALRHIRKFWQAAKPDERWARNWVGNPQDAEIDPANDVNIGKGACERFVADALAGSGIDFTWPNLNSAWASLGRRLKAEQLNE